MLVGADKWRNKVESPPFYQQPSKTKQNTHTHTQKEKKNISRLFVVVCKLQQHIDADTTPGHREEKFQYQRVYLRNLWWNVNGYDITSILNHYYNWSDYLYNYMKRCWSKAFFFCGSILYYCLTHINIYRFHNPPKNWFVYTRLFSLYKFQIPIFFLSSLDFTINLNAAWAIRCSRLYLRAGCCFHPTITFSLYHHQFTTVQHTDNMRWVIYKKRRANYDMASHKRCGYIRNTTIQGKKNREREREEKSLS